MFWNDADESIHALAIELKASGLSCGVVAKQTGLDYKSLYRKLYHKQVGQVKNSVSILQSRIHRFCGSTVHCFSAEQLLLKIGPEPKCYLTGRPIDLNDSSSYHLDHIVPTSRGGSSSIDNCQIACAIANKSKTNMTLDEYYALCREVLNNANLFSY